MTRSAERRLAVPVQGDPRSPTDAEAAATAEPAGVSKPAEAAGPADAAGPAEADVSGPTITRLADDLLPLLIARLEASSLGEIEVSRDGWRVRLRRSSLDGPQADATHAGRPSDRRAGAAPDPGGDAAGSPGAGAGGSPAEGRAARAERERSVITAPAVGYYLPRDGLQVGETVRGGDLLGHVDVLGVRQEVVIPVDGRLSRLLAESGEAVEYGQALARLEPETRG